MSPLILHCMISLLEMLSFDVRGAGITNLCVHRGEPAAAAAAVWNELPSPHLPRTESLQLFRARFDAEKHFLTFKLLPLSKPTEISSSCQQRFRTICDAALATHLMLRFL